MPEGRQGRAYSVPTNTPAAVELPSLTVTVRAAFFVPAVCLPPEDAGETRGRETWTGGGDQAVPATFEMSLAPIESGPISLAPVCGPDRKLVLAKRRNAKTGVACTEVRFSRILDEAQLPRPREVAEARLPLFGKVAGTYLLKVVPQELTSPEGPAGPATEVRSVARAFRPLFVRLTFDDLLHLVAAETCTLRRGRVHGTDAFPTPGPRGIEELELPVNHGYVTAFAADQLAIDLKPDVLRSRILELTPQPANRKRTAGIDMVVIHATADALMGSGVNTARPMHYVMIDLIKDGEPVIKDGKPVKVRKQENGHDIPIPDDCLGPHYEVDRDGHVVKFLPEEYFAFHTDHTNYYLAEEGKFVNNVNARSIGIELTHKTDTAYPRREILGLLGLLARINEVHKLPRHRFVGHVDVYVHADTLVMHDDRLNCPGRDLDWPAIEAAGFGRKTVAKKLGPEDYDGFFLLTADDLRVVQGQDRPLPPALRPGDSDKGRIWGGIEWRGLSTIGVARAIPFAGIVAELQADLQILGYSVEPTGVYETRTDRAVAHFAAHTFAGPRRHGRTKEGQAAAEAALHVVEALAAAAGRPVDDPSWILQESIPSKLGAALPVTRLIASYIKGTAEAVRHDVRLAALARAVQALP